MYVRCAILGIIPHARKSLEHIHDDINNRSTMLLHMLVVRYK